MPAIKALLVDDEINYRSALGERLSLRGLVIGEAGSGEECLEQLPGFRPDVIVLDVQMPGIDGLETLARIKEMDDEVEVIMLTGHASTQDGVKGIKLGAFDYLSKPVDLVQLHRKILQAQDSQLRRKERRREAEYRRRMEQRMAQAERLSALGTLAVGVAHEVNNPLAIINESAGWLEVLAGKLDSDSPPSGEQFLKPLKVIARNVARARAITHQLLEYARGEDYRTVAVDMEKELLDLADIMGPEARERGIALSVHNNSDRKEVRTDPDQLRHVLSNLLANALDAASSGGEVSLCLEDAPRGLAIEVRDTGPGIDAETLKKIFDPFFSTKPQGQGKGLGLFTAKTIVEKLGGRMEVASTPGSGSVFSIIMENSA